MIIIQHIIRFRKVHIIQSEAILIKNQFIQAYFPSGKYLERFLIVILRGIHLNFCLKCITFWFTSYFQLSLKNWEISIPKADLSKVEQLLWNIDLVPKQMRFS